MERSLGEGDDHPVQYFCLENSMNRVAWWPQSMGSQKVGHDWTVNTHTHTQGWQLKLRERILFWKKIWIIRKRQNHNFQNLETPTIYPSGGEWINRKQLVKATYCMIPTQAAFWRRHNYRDRKGSVVARSWGKVVRARKLLYLKLQ